MRLILAVISAFFMIAGNASAQLNKLAFEEYTLENGLHVILHQDKSTPIVAVSVMYHVGSKNENPERTGFAHFFEHLMFEGSDNMERGQFDKFVQNAGGDLNANTTFDRTYYYEMLPSNQLGLGLWLESERMMHAKVDEKGIETQREVVKEERRQRIDNQPYGSILEETFKRAYQVHPYKWPVIGSMAHLAAAEENDYKQFYADFYVPNNAVLSIAGDIDFAEAKVMIEKYFGPIPKSPKAVYRPRVVEPNLTAEIRDTIFDNIQLPAVIQAYRIPAQGTKDYYAVDMLSRILSNGESSRLYRSLVDEQQKALFVGNFPLALEDPGISLAFGITNMGVSVQELENAMDAEVAKVQKELITEKEFEKLRNQIESEFVTNNSRMSGIAENLATYHMFFGDANLINTEIDRYLAVTREDIMAAAKRYLVNTNRVVLYYLPKSQETKS
ncbi:MAG: insulinase family protein [Bacteroidota bacterium]|nr:insulinase family protein [Bacteroidota bacterium]